MLQPEGFECGMTWQWTGGSRIWGIWNRRMEFTGCDRTWYWTTPQKLFLARASWMKALDFMIRPGDTDWLGITTE
jgi:hypothetical protein